MFNRANFIIATALCFLLTVVLLLSAWRPAHQVCAHTKASLAAVENNNWLRLDNLLTADYNDRWQDDKPFLLERIHAIGAQFLVCGIQTGEIAIELSGSQATVSTPLALTGRGGPLAEAAMQRESTSSANRSPSPGANHPGSRGTGHWSAPASRN